MLDCFLRLSKGNLQPAAAKPSEREIRIHGASLLNQSSTRLQFAYHTGKYPSAQTDRHSVIPSQVYRMPSQPFGFADFFSVISDPATYSALCVTSRSLCICRGKTRIEFNSAGEQRQRFNIGFPSPFMKTRQPSQ